MEIQYYTKDESDAHLFKIDLIVWKCKILQW